MMFNLRWNDALWQCFLESVALRPTMTMVKMIFPNTVQSYVYLSVLTTDKHLHFFFLYQHILSLTNFVVSLGGTCFWNGPHSLVPCSTQSKVTIWANQHIQHIQKKRNTQHDSTISPWLQMCEQNSLSNFFGSDKSPNCIVWLHSYIPLSVIFYHRFHTIAKTFKT